MPVLVTFATVVPRPAAPQGVLFSLLLRLPRGQPLLLLASILYAVLMAFDLGWRWCCRGAPDGGSHARHREALLPLIAMVGWMCDYACKAARGRYHACHVIPRTFRTLIFAAARALSRTTHRCAGHFCLPCSCHASDPPLAASFLTLPSLHAASCRLTPV